MEVLSLMGDGQVISLQRTKVYVFSDSVLCLVKMNKNPRSNVAWGDRLTWFKSSPEYRTVDWIDGEPMEFEWNVFPGFSTLQLASHKVHELLLRLSVTPEKNYRKDHLHVDVSRHLMGIKRQQERMRVKCSTRFSLCKEIWNRTMVISRCLVRRKGGILQVKIVHKVNGTKWQRNDGDTRRKRTPSLSSHESIVQRSAQEQSPWKIIDTLLCRPGTIETFFFAHFLQKCVKNMNLFMIERRNPLWEDSRVLHSCQAWSRQTRIWLWRSWSQRSSVAKIRRTNWKVFTTRQIVQILYGCRIPECCWNWTVFHDERHCGILTIHRCSGLSWVHLAKRWRFIWTKKVGSEGTPKLGPYWKLQLVACMVNTEWKSELNLWTKTILTHGSEFFMDQQVCDEFWTTTSRKLQECSSKNMR